MDRNVHTFESGAIREDNTNKGRCDLLPMCALIRLSKYFQDNLGNHPERNWEKGIPIHSYIDSALRHLFKYVDGRTDEDHLCAASWNVLCAMWTEEKLPGMQDIPSRPGSLDKKIGEEAIGKDTCKYWGDAGGSSYFCRGTKNLEACYCNGDRSACDFYPALPPQG